jgi:hypothetical protein
MTWSRRLLALAAVAYVFAGLTFFLIPDYAAANFPWAVSPFVAMTIGGWALGIGFMARESIRRFEPSRVYPTLMAVWAFSFLELAVTVVFISALRTDSWLTWPYLVALGLGSASAALGVPTLWRMRAQLASQGDGLPGWIRATYAAFVVVTGLLALTTLIVVPTSGAVFPEPLGVFTARAFAAFFAALAIGALPLLRTRDVEPAAHYARAGIYPIALILVAAFSYLHLFDFGARPGGFIYIGAYVLTGVVAVAIVLWHRRETAEPDLTPRY